MAWKLRRFQLIRHARPVVAVAEIQVGGLLLRGLKLEAHEHGYELDTAGRKIQGGWQKVYEFLEPELLEAVKGRLIEEYLGQAEPGMAPCPPREARPALEPPPHPRREALAELRAFPARAAS